MGNKKRQRTAQYHLKLLDRLALGEAQTAIERKNFERLVRQGVIVPYRQDELERMNKCHE